MSLLDLTIFERCLRRFRRQTETDAQAAQAEAKQEEQRDRRTAQVIATWWEEGFFFAAINRGKNDGVRVHDVYLCRHPTYRREVRDDQGKLLKFYYVNETQVIVTLRHDDWSQCQVHSAHTGLRPTGFRDDMRATFVKNYDDELHAVSFRH